MKPMMSTLVWVAVFFIACGAEKKHQPVEVSAVADPVSEREGGKKSAAMPSEKNEETAIVVMGDSRGRERGVYRYALKRALDHVVAEGRAKTVVFSGDMVQGASTASRLEAQLKVWNDLVKPYRDKGLRFLVTSGNHEIDDGTMLELDPGRLGKPTNGALELLKTTKAAFPDLPRNGPKDGGLTYWVRIGEVLIVVLDSFRPGYFNTVDTAWLEKILSGPAAIQAGPTAIQAGPTALPPPSHIFVATHSPAFPVGGHTSDSLSNYNLDRKEVAAAGGDRWPWQPGTGGPRDVDVDWRGKRDAFWKILVDHKVTAFFAGHEHCLSHQRVDGVWQIISGALTKRLYPENKVPLEMYDGNPQNPLAGDTVWHGGDTTWGYFLISVRGGKAKAEVFGWTTADDSMRLIKEIPLD